MGVSGTISSFLQTNWTLQNLPSNKIDWKTDRSSIAVWMGNLQSNNVLIGCYEVGGVSSRASLTALVTDDPIQVKIVVKGQGRQQNNQALRDSVFNAVKGILLNGLNSLISGNIKIAALRSSGIYDVVQYSSRDLIVICQYPEGS